MAVKKNKKKATGSKTCARVKGHTKKGKKIKTYARKKAKK